MYPEKDYEYALKLIKKNKIVRFYEKFSHEDLVILYDIGAISKWKYYKFANNRYHNRYHNKTFEYWNDFVLSVLS
jgi:hypothetical protein